MDYTYIRFIFLVVIQCSSGLDINVKLQGHYRTMLNSPSYIQSIINVPPTGYRYIIVQATSQANNISLSYSNSSKYGKYANSTSVGLVYMLKGHEKSISSYLAAPQKPTDVQIQAIPYSWKDPVPGGCCTTCSFDNDPNILIINRPSQLDLVFPRANVFHNQGSLPAICDGGKFSTYRLQYDMYAYQLDENDLSVSGLFNGISKMSSVSSIKYYGTKVGSIKGSSKARFLVQSLPFQGIVFNIVVRDTLFQTEAAYNPTYSYGCDITDKTTCKSFGSMITVFYAIIAGVIGLALCFIGHKLFKIELFVSGSISGFIISYIMLLRFGNLEYTHRMLGSTAIGILVGLCLILIWMKTSFLHVCMVNNNALIGFLVSCSIMFSPIGLKETFSSNLVYISTVICIALVFPIPLVFFPKLSSITFSSFYGAFAVVLACSLFMHANLQYLIVEFVLRAGIPSFADAYLRVPFQRNDYILCGVWATLFVTGASIQYFITRNDRFPPQHKSKKSTRRRHRGRRADERTPLLQGENIQYGVILKPSNASINVI